MEVYTHSSYEFHVVRKLGSGAFGEVYEVSLLTCKFKYALKKFSPQRNIAEASVFSEGELIKRFSQETRYQTNCHHKNIVPICVVHLGDTPFFVMDLADSDLSTLLANDSLKRDERIKAILDIIDGLEYIHNKGLVHRDLKPQNVLVFNGVYKISDFGLIKSVTANNNDVVTAIRVRLGTEDYMAPELKLAGHYSHLTDIFSLGVIISEFKIHELDKVVDKCTNRTVRFRYQSVSEVRNEILRAIK